MLALRLARGARPVAQLRRLVLAATAAGVGFLLLAALAYATANPTEPGEAFVRLAWCLLPLAATAQLAASVARADPVTEPRSALDAVSLAPRRLRAHAALSTALAALLGVAAAVLVFLQLRGKLGSVPLFDGQGIGLPVGGPDLPLAGALTLLALVPVTVAVAGGLAVPARERAAAAGALLPWGAALVAAGTAVGGYAAATAGDTDGLPLPGTLGGVSAGVLLGWTLSVAGVVLAAPGLAQAAARLLTLGRPGALRLLAGRTLQREASRLGAQLGTVSASTAAALAATRLDGPVFAGGLGLLGAGVVLLAVVGATLTTAASLRTERASATETLRELGAAPRLMRRARLLRAATLLAVFVPLTWLTAALLTLPLPG
ncbi:MULTISPECIES: hypothetical protein [Streptomyces]|uniref:hypothetical protein n=1 Tax=Streptomyces TaxID=1883 RepID=UPI000CD5BC05|nr:MULTISPECIES: hypothetical protein [Streptomyces]